MPVTAHQLASLYGRAHDLMRSSDGLQPLEAFDELLKYLLFRERSEDLGEVVAEPSLFVAGSLFASDPEGTASSIQRLFAECLREDAPWALQLWPDARFRISATTLLQVHDLFRELKLDDVPFDMRSSALSQFLTPGMRRSLGIYLTPDDIVRMVVELVAASPGQRVYDPACGSGTFLIETAASWSSRPRADAPSIWGSDTNARMLLLAQLNLGHSYDIDFRDLLRDALAIDAEAVDGWPEDGTFDAVLTNPPFGMVVDSRTYDFGRFQTCLDDQGYRLKHQQSEVIFVERCLGLLRPGGTLAIVVPRSVITNRRLHHAREAIESLGHVYAVVGLPPETFALTGTQVNTAVLFMRRYEAGEERSAMTRIAWVNVQNVGIDSTGRPRTGSELPDVAAAVRSSLDTGCSSGLSLLSEPVPKHRSLSMLGQIMSTPEPKAGGDREQGPRLGDLLEAAATGRTPQRSAYSDEGLFLVKVRNLTGHGISWTPSERNFAAGKDAASRRRSPRMMLAPGDLVLTSSAHSPVYIAQKVDVIPEIPDWIGGAASFVAEVMMLRPNRELVDPYALLTFLRTRTAVERIQLMVTGQTAHLRPDDLMELRIPPAVLAPDRGPLLEAATLLRQECELAVQTSCLARDLRSLVANCEGLD